MLASLDPGSIRDLASKLADDEIRLTKSASIGTAKDKLQLHF